MINETIDIELKVLDENEKETTKTLKVTLQEVSPFKTADIFAENITGNGKIRKSGGFIKDCMNIVIMSPKNLVEEIEKAENAFEVIGQLANEVQEFINSPRLYKLKRQELLQKKSNEESSTVGEDLVQSNTDGSEAVNNG